MPPNLVDFIGTQAGNVINPKKLKEGTANRPSRSNFYPIAAAIGAVLVIVASAGIYYIKHNRAAPGATAAPPATAAPATAKPGNAVPR